MKTLALAVVTVALLNQTASAATWCATVSTDVPEGRISVHGAPSEAGPVLRELATGEYIELNTNLCGHELDAERTILGTVCAQDDQWGAVEYIKSADVGAFLAPQNHKGWVSKFLLTRVDCVAR